MRTTCSLCEQDAGAVEVLVDGDDCCVSLCVCVFTVPLMA